MEGVKIEFKREFAEGLVAMISELLRKTYSTDDDRLVMASLAEVKQRLDTRMVQIKKTYTMTMTPAQSLSLRILFTDFPKCYTPHMGIKLLQISEQVASKY
jgi:hypothetical protein